MAAEKEIKSKTFFGVIWKLLERVCAQVVTFAVSLLLARLLAPNDYGIIAIVVMTINILNVFVTSGYGAALIQNPNATEREFNIMCTFSVMFAILLYIILFAAAPWMADFYEEPIISPLTRVMALRLPIAAFNSIQQAYVAKKMEYKKFFWATLFGTIASGIIGCWMAFNGFGVWALVGQYLTNTFIDSIVLYVTFHWRYHPEFSWRIAKPMIKFGSTVLMSSLVDAAYQEIRTAIIGKKYSANALAYYNRGEQFPKLFVLNLSTAIDGTLLPTFSLVQDDLKKLEAGLLRAMQVSTMLVCPLMLGMMVTAKPMITLALTEKWLPAVIYVQLFCLMYLFNPLQSASNQMIKAMGHGRVFLQNELIKKLIFVILLCASVPFGPEAIAVSAVTSSAVAAGINMFCVKKLIGCSVFKQLGAIIPQFLLSLVMAAACWCIQYVVPSQLLLVVQIVVGIAVYVLGLLITQNQAFSYILGIVLRKKRS